MSLAVLANHMASKGRNGDTMLVHMSPEEVHGLHALALTHGEKMTINPETGLPEAFSLKSLLKSVLPAVAGFALGPAGFGIVSSALGAGALVGGATALATGSLQKGIMAGLGAYGGANLGGALSTAGMGAAQDAALSSLSPEQIAGRAAFEGLTEQGYKNLLTEQATRDYLSKGFLDRTMGGISALGSEAGRNAFMQGVGGTSGLLRSGMAAAAPVMADAMTPTATPMPTGGGYQYKPQIRPMAFNQYGQTLEQLPMFSAIGTTQQQQQQPPGGMNTGGIVALAAGGPPKGAMSPEEFKKMIYAGGANDAEATRRGIEYVMNTPGFRPDTATQYWNQALGTKFTEGDYFRVMKDLGKDPYYYEKQFDTKPGPVTGGTVTPGTSTPVGGGQPIVVPPVKAETIPGYQGEDKIYGGDIVIPKYVAPDLGTPGKAYTGTQTIKEIRDEYTKGGGTTEMPTLKDFKPTVTGDSKAAYDYLMGQGPYPLNPVIPGGGPIMKPYAESTGMVSPGFFGRQGAVDESGRFVPKMPPTGGVANDAGGTKGDVGVGSQFTDTLLRPGGTSIVYGPTGMPYANAAAARAAGVTDYSTTPPGTPITDFLFGKQDPNNVPVEDRNISYSNAAVQERIDNVLNDRDRSFYYDYAAPSRSFDDTSPLAKGGIAAIAAAGAAHGGDVHRYNLGGYSDGGRLLRGPGDGVSDSIPATIGGKQPARLADGEFVIPARIVSEIGNGSTEAGARKLYAMMDRVQRARAKTTGKGRVAKDTKADRYLPA